MKRLSKTIVLAILIVSVPCVAPAESIFSVNGLGETVFGVDARGMAMGGAGLANISPWHISLDNPALLARVERFSFGAALVPELRRIELEDSDKSASFAYFPFLRLTHRLPGGLAGAAAIGSQQRVSYRLEEVRLQEDLSVVETWSGEGGPGFVSLSLAREISDRLLFGAELRILVGTIEDERILKFIGEPSLDTRDVVKTSFGGEPLGRLGGHFDLGHGVSIGGSYQFSHVMALTTTLVSRGEWQGRTESNLTYPAMGGLGVCIKPNDRATFTAEWFRAAWGQTGHLEGYNGEMVDADRISIGFEWERGEDYRVPLRLGYLWRELSYRAAGASSPPTEFAFTAGFGLPFRRDNGSLDVAIQIGARGDVEAYGARERFLRFTLSMVGTEFLGHLISDSK